MRDGKLFPYIFEFFTGIFGMRQVQCYLSVQVTVLLEIVNSTLIVSFYLLCITCEWMIGRGVKMVFSLTL